MRVHEGARSQGPAGARLPRASPLSLRTASPHGSQVRAQAGPGGSHGGRAGQAREAASEDAPKVTRGVGWGQGVLSQSELETEGHGPALQTLNINEGEGVNGRVPANCSRPGGRDEGEGLMND